MQVPHHRDNYTEETLMRQAGMYMLRHPYKYYKCLEFQLLESGESYESYCYNVYNRNVWGDDLVAAVIGDMWNIAISIVTPIHTKPVALFHNKDEPDVVIVANGGNYTSKKKPCTHFTATRSYNPDFKKPGTEYLNPTLSQDLTAKMNPIILDDKNKAKQLACKEFLSISKERSLNLMRGLCQNINHLDDRICDMIAESTEICKQQKQLEFQLEKISIIGEKIKAASSELKEDRGYCRTIEREKIDEEAKKKRKAEEELKEQEEERLKTITRGAGEEEEKQKEKEKHQDEEDRTTKLARQQSEIIKSQEALLLRQEQHILEQERKIRRLEREQEERPQKRQKLDDGSSSVINPSTSGRGVLEKYVPAHLLKYIPSRSKPEGEDIITVDDVDDQDKQSVEEGIVEESEVLVTSVTKKTETVKYIPKIVPGVQNVVLIEAPKTKTTAKRSSKAGPVPEELQDKTKFYCKKCPCNYRNRDDLVRHEKNDCGKEDPDFFCDVCNAGYFSENTVREHYYQIHTDIKLWRCKKCNEGFHFKANRSRHKNACPKKNGPEVYEGRAHYDEKLEQTFKRKIAIPVQVPPNQQPVVIGDPATDDQPEGDQPQGAQPQGDQLQGVPLQGDPAVLDTGAIQMNIQPIENPPPQELGKETGEEQYDFTQQQFGDASDLIETLEKGIIPDQPGNEGDIIVKPEEDAMLDVEMKFDV